MKEKRQVSIYTPQLLSWRSLKLIFVDGDRQRGLGQRWAAEASVSQVFPPRGFHSPHRPLPPSLPGSSLFLKEMSRSKTPLIHTS